ncbi:MAG TPA: hypothetical protein VFO85_06545, partial [Vicinamibacteria bacterium]|nr:hypothetical protein [Vicinamibacteria bacterium]
MTLLAAPLEAVVAPRAQEKEFRAPGLTIPSLHTPASELSSRLAAQLPDLAALGVPAEGAFYDPLAQRWASLLPTEPLIPGTGVGNPLTWAGLGITGQPTEAQIKAAAWEAFVAYLQRVQALGVNVDELSRSPRLAVFEDGAIVQIYVQRVLAGVPVRDSSITATINHGNLVLLGLTNWAAASPVADPSLAAEQARAVVAAHASPRLFTATDKPRLEFVPYAPSGDARQNGYEYRLVWVVDGTTGTDRASWEGLVDAASGELLAFQDKNQYVS